MKPADNIRVEITVSNTGKVDGEEIVQLYLRDLVASVSRPVIELKDFKKIKLKAGEKKTIQFVIDKNKLSFYNQQLDWTAEPGKFDIMIGASARDIRVKETFELLK
jgi:beta-glucosidase